MIRQTPTVQSSFAAPHISALWLKCFAGYNQCYLRRNFHSLRILQSGLPRITDQPTIIYLNHASWWDPLVCLFLAREFFADRSSFAPIDTAMLERYRFFRHLGFFGIEPETARGARTLLRTGRAILASSHNLLWLTPQGRFADPRERPLRLRDGLGALAAQLHDVAFLPLAIEYPFWTESRPEILVSFGPPITRAHPRPRRPNEWTRLLSCDLELSQAQLAAHATKREPGDWRILNRGRAGVNPIYDTILWLGARLRGQHFSGEHQPHPVR